MNYQAIYDSIIHKHSNTPKLKKQTNEHHIIPRSFAKIDDIADIDGSWNKVNLPLREHFIAHLLLARIWRHDKHKGKMMAFAFRRMSNCGKYTSKTYQWLKLNYEPSQETKEKISKSKKGVPLSETNKQNISKANKGKLLTEDHKQKIKAARTGTTRLESTKQKISKANLGRKLTEETKQKMSNSHKGVPKSDQQKQKISKAQRGIPKPKIRCSFCGKEIGGTGNFNKHLRTH